MENDADSPLISVVVPAYNVAQFIADALDSVLVQTFSDYEIIVVNDGSPDTPELERALEPYRHRIVYLVQENRGLAGARNTAIRAARGQWIALLDADDIWEADFLESQVMLLRQQPRAALVYADARFFGDSPLTGRTVMELSPSHGEVTFQKLVSRECVVVLPTIVVRREAILRAGLFDESLRRVEDVDLWLRISKQGGRIAYQRRVLARYRRRADSLSADHIAMFEAYLRVLENIRKHPDLTADEASAVDWQIARELANRDLEQARQAFLANQFSLARNLLKRANAHFRKPIYYVVLVLLGLTPDILRRAYACRHRDLLKGNLA